MQSASPLPLIGITIGRWQRPSGVTVQGLPEAYVQALTQAGAIPVLLPLGLPDEHLTRLLATLDGVLFSGGGDVHPERYASQWRPQVAGVDPDRDRVEIQLLQRALPAELPFLGICRGLQVINVALGGSLYEDILDQRPNALVHQNDPEHPRDYLAHPVQVAAGSRLAEILGERQTGVNSLHHQGIRRLAPGLQATAHAPDGLIEAFELEAHPFGLAVQWHPECLPEQAAMQRLFQAFVQACAGRRSAQ